MNTNDEVYLIDTSAWMHVLSRDAPAGAKAFLDQLIAADRAASAGVIFLELLAGCKSKKEFEDFKQELEAVIYFSISDEVWIKAAILCSTLREKGITVPTIDALIASIAMENLAGLVHIDKHFDFISQHSSLKSINLLQLRTGSS